MWKNKTLIFLLVSLLCTGSYAFGEKKSIHPSELRIIAHYKEKIQDQIFAAGNVEIHYRDLRLFADRVEVDSETKDVFAEGNVLIQLPDEVYSAERVRFNLDTSRGKLHEVFGMIQPALFYEAESIEKKEENLYNFRKARITTCTQARPRWKFTCSSATFKKDQYVEMWNSIFSIKKIPVFYFPYLRYPIRERATGFLTPQIGYSEHKGFLYSQSFYWAMRRNMDATVNFDYYSIPGMGGGLEYRYLLPKGTGGVLNIYYFDFKEDPELEYPERAYLFRFDHNQTLPFHFGLVASVDYQSSYDFLREFDNNFRRAIVSNRSSQVYLLRSWSHFNFNMRVSRFETYYKEKDNSYLKYNLPEFGFSSSKIKLFSPLYFSLSSSFIHWESGWETDFEAGGQKGSQSFAFSPELTFPFTVIPWLPINLSLSNNFNYYFKSYEPNTREIVEEPLLIHNYALQLEMDGPVFYKIFYGDQHTPKLKHIIEPSFTYYYESPLAYPERIIDYRSRYRYHRISYGLANRILIRQNEMPREIFVLGVEQNFYILPEESPLKNYDVNGKIPRFTDISGYLRFYPASNYTLDFSADFNPYFNTFSGLRVGADLGSKDDSFFLRVNWYKSLNPYYDDERYTRHQISAFGGFKIPVVSLEALAQVDFNIKEREMLYSAFSLVYHYQCLDFKADLKIFYFRDKPETQFRVSIGLGNIGKTTDLLGGMGY